MVKKIKTTEYCVETVCAVCSTKFYARSKPHRNGKAQQYCSRQCAGVGKRGVTPKKPDRQKAVDFEVIPKKKLPVSAEALARATYFESKHNHLGLGVSKAKYDFYRRKYPGYNPKFDEKGNFIIPKDVRLRDFRSYAGNEI